jgi:hypothetical protein
MKIINVQENKIFAGEEDFLKFISITGVTPHASIAGVYNGIAKIAEEKGSKIFTTSKSSEKEKIQNAIDNRLKEDREEVLYESWEDFKEEFSEEKQEALQEWDQKFDGDFYFVELTGLACDTYSKYGKIQNTNSIVIFKVEDKENLERIDLQHKEIFCIDRQFGNPTEKRKNGKCKIINRGENIKASVLKALEGVEIFEDNLFFAYKQKDILTINEIKENIFANLSIEIDNIVNIQVEEENKIEEERRMERQKRIEEEENRIKNKEKQKEAQKKAKEAAQNAEKRVKAIAIYKKMFKSEPTEEQIQDIINEL